MGGILLACSSSQIGYSGWTCGVHYSRLVFSSNSSCPSVSHLGSKQLTKNYSCSLEKRELAVRGGDQAIIGVAFAFAHVQNRCQLAPKGDPSMKKPPVAEKTKLWEVVLTRCCGD
ncbi:hypothetical protein NQ024_07130 [Corynebacterium sp. 35RC1]|nr:hypothetical protein [Corynebacterium sp. 35RC1]